MKIYTEFEMADSFLELLKENSLTRLPKFDYVFREVTCPQGIADFVALTSNGLMTQYSFDRVSSIESCCQILTFLKNNSGRTLKYVCSQTGLDIINAKKYIREMIHNGYVREEKGLLYRNIPDVSSHTLSWAFELKLTNWKRAIFQALQYKAFSNYSIVVFPYEKEKVLVKNIHFFKELNVGLLLFDVSEHKIKWLYYPKKDNPISKWHSFFTIGKITNQGSSEKNIDEM